MDVLRAEGITKTSFSALSFESILEGDIFNNGICSCIILDVSGSGWSGRSIHDRP